MTQNELTLYINEFGHFILDDFVNKAVFNSDDERILRLKTAFPIIFHRNVSYREVIIGCCALLSHDKTVDAEKIADVLKRIKSILIRKNDNYGNSALTQPQLAPKISVTDALLVRLSDKLNRLENIYEKKTKDKVGESLQDTLHDIMGYTILLWIAKFKMEHKDKRSVPIVIVPKNTTWTNVMEMIKSNEFIVMASNKDE